MYSLVSETIKPIFLKARTLIANVEFVLTLKDFSTKFIWCGKCCDKFNRSEPAFTLVGEQSSICS